MGSNLSLSPFQDAFSQPCARYLVLSLSIIVNLVLSVQQIISSEYTYEFNFIFYVSSVVNVVANTFALNSESVGTVIPPVITPICRWTVCFARNQRDNICQEYFTSKGSVQIVL